MSDLKAVIFDMDGVLIDSEPLWKRAQIKIFGAVGLHLTRADTDLTVGVRIDDVVKFWFDRSPSVTAETAGVARSIVDEVIRLVGVEAKRMDGVSETLALFKSLGCPLGLATSSSDRLIEAVLKALQLEDTFDVRCSAADEEFGKPHPAVFLTTAAQLGVDPAACLVIEDSVFGVQAGKAAGMTVLAVPSPYQFDVSEFDQADLKLRSLAEFSQETLDMLY